jgi:hypothetical protein
VARGTVVFDALYGYFSRRRAGERGSQR